MFKFYRLFFKMIKVKPSDIQIRLAENLKRIRKKQKLTQFELGEKAGVSDETIKNIELCKTWTSEKTLSQLTEALNIDVHLLFLPVSSSFNKDVTEDNQRIKECIIENLHQFIDENLKKMAASED